MNLLRLIWIPYQLLVLWIDKGKIHYRTKTLSIFRPLTINCGGGLKLGFYCWRNQIILLKYKTLNNDLKMNQIIIFIKKWGLYAKSLGSINACWAFYKLTLSISNGICLAGTWAIQPPIYLILEIFMCSVKFNS